MSLHIAEVGLDLGGKVGDGQAHDLPHPEKLFEGQHQQRVGRGSEKRAIRRAGKSSSAKEAAKIFQRTHGERRLTISNKTPNKTVCDNHVYKIYE